MIFRRRRSIFDFLDAPIGKVKTQSGFPSEFARQAYQKPKKKPKFAKDSG